MLIDASVIVAILKSEDDADKLAARIVSAVGPLFVTPVVVYESSVSVATSLARQRGEARCSETDFRTAEALVGDFLADVRAECVPLSAEMGAVAIAASRRFGKVAGHKAGLNMGDCFAYAAARVLKVPLLWKGADFGETDIESGPVE
jgi:ribonuclease VapC